MRQFLVILTLAFACSANAMDIDGPLDQFGQPFKLSSWGEDRLVVVAFLGTECPLGGLYSNRLNELHAKYANRGVCFVAVNSNHHDSYSSMVQFAKDLRFSIVKDEGSVVADEFGATRSPEVFLLNAGRDVIYSGRIDDQYEPGFHSRTAPSRNDLEEAIVEALNWRPISVPRTEPVGCHINRDHKQRPVADDVTYSKHIAPIFDSKCAGCHRVGEVAPFQLLSYDDAAAWTETIRDVIVQKRMPPWNVESRYPLANDRALTADERSLILAWIDAGAPEGNRSDRPIPPTFAEGWAVKPDVVLGMAKPFTVPREGLLDYQEFVIDPCFSGDVWVDSVEIRPGNNKVVHHATIYLKPQGAKPGVFYFDEMFDNYLALYVPGNSATILPKGTAKRIPGGFNLHLSIHYVPNGSTQSDQTRIGLRFAKDQTIQIATHINAAPITLEPGEIKTVVADQVVENDSLLFALYPHMHLRGKSMLFTLIYPEGRSEDVLHVPDYDFEWQHRYVLVTPLVLPAGTVLRCTGVYDNSIANKRNPDPTAFVRSGESTTDEMFFGAYEVGRPIPGSNSTSTGPGNLLAGVAIGCLWIAHKRFSAA